MCVCGSIPTIEKVGEKTPWSCTQTYCLDPHSDPLDPDADGSTSLLSGH